MFNHTTTLLTADCLMSREVETIRDDMPLRDAASRLTGQDLHGVPVVNAEGRCVGVLSAADLVRWVAGRDHAVARSPTCGYQEKRREPGGGESILCRLPKGVCSLQQSREVAGGSVVFCTDPYSVPTDWQVVRPEAVPAGVVRDVMTTDVVTADPAAPVAELARIMLDRGVRRLVVVDGARRPVGVVSASDLLQVLAHPDLTAVPETP